MKKNLFVLLAVLALTSLVFFACAPVAPSQPAPAEAPAAEAPAAEAPAAEKPMKIAFFVSDLSNVFHQAQFTEAKKYAKEPPMKRGFTRPI